MVLVQKEEACQRGIWETLERLDRWTGESKGGDKPWASLAEWKLPWDTYLKSDSVKSNKKHIFQ